MNSIMLCRICLSDLDTETECKNIFADDNINNLQLLIFKYLNIDAKIEDSFSNIICLECLANLQNFHRFYLRIEQIQGDFKIKLNEIKTEVLEFDEVISENNEIQIEHKIVLNDCTNDFIFNDIELAENDISEIDEDNESSATNNKDYETDETYEPSNEEIKNVEKNLVIKIKRSQLDSKKEKPKTQYKINDEKTNLKISSFMKLICNLCGKELETFTLLKQHFRTEHKQKGYAICCQKKFDKRIYLSDHIDAHLNPNQFKCTICHKIQQNHNQLSHHMRTVHEAVNSVQCDICLRVVSNKQALELHKFTHIEDKNFKCTTCEKAFGSEYQLKQHSLKVHENLYKNICHVCGKIIKDKRLFRKHQAEHEGFVEPKKQCEKCGIWLKNEMSLRKHELNIHAEENKKHICSICNRECPSKGALKSHKNYIHNRRLFPCTICNKQFRKQVSLREHMTSHTGEILYTCPHCPKTFASNANYHHHRKKEHRKEWEETRLNKLKPPPEFQAKII